MHRLAVVSVSHRTAPLAILERVAIRREERAALLDRLQAGGSAEAVILTTCGRTEIYSVLPSDADLDRMLAAFAGQTGLSWDALRQVSSLRRGAEVAAHLFRVASGLESRLLGELDIRIQVRAALSDAGSAAGPLLRSAFARALRVSRRIRAETALGESTRSLGEAAVVVGLRTAQSRVPFVVVIGAGRMAGVVVTELHRSGHHPFLLARDRAAARRMACGNDRVGSMAELTDAVRQADLLVCATSAPHHVVTAAQVHAVLGDRSGHPLTIVDVSVPRNVDAVVGRIQGINLLDLEALCVEPVSERVRTAVPAAERIVSEELERFSVDLAVRQAGPLLHLLRQRLAGDVRREVVPAGGQCTLDDDRTVHALAGVLLHPLATFARATVANGDVRTLARLAEAYGIDLAAAGIVGGT